MIFKRKQATTATTETTVDDLSAAPATPETDDTPDAKSAPSDRAANGPFDVTEVPAIRPYIDMGSIKVAPREGLKVRLDIDEASKRIIAISLDYEGSTLQVQAFSAPKSTGLWHAARQQILASLQEQGAQVTERESVFGTEVLMQSPPNAEQVAAVRFFGVDGPRWMLRGVLVGAGAVDPARAGGIEAVFRELVVVRGDAPLPPSELLPLQMPANVAQAPTA